MNLETQECKYCLKTLHVSMFNRAPRNTNGINRKCKICMAEDHRKKNPIPPPPEDLQGEEWRQIIGYDGDYEVSNYGRVKSYKKGLIKLLEVHYSKKGYPVVHITKLHSQPKTRVIHRLVGLAFIPNLEKLPQINHKDGIKSNNCVDNLEWCDNTYNQRHAWEKGLGNPSKGVKNGNSCLTDEKVISIRMEKATMSYTQLIDKYGVSKKTIQSIVYRKTWKHI